VNIITPPGSLKADEIQIKSDLLARFAAIVGERYAITDPALQEQYLREMRDLYHGHTPMVLRPGSVAEVSAILRLANETRTPVVPQGGNTGLVGGQVPHHGEIVLSLNRLDKIREVDATSNTITAEAGVSLGRVREAAANVDRLYPLLLPSEGTCTVGGNLSTNAGGTTAVSWGVARAQALGLEVVLADGRVLNNLNKLKKDNTGYDLKNLFIGAEGTLGVITAATLRMIARPRSVETAFVGLASPDAALELLGIANEKSGGNITSFELMVRLGLDAVLKYDPGSRDPLNQMHPWYVLIELSAQARTGLRDTMEEILAEGVERGLVADAAISSSLEQTKAFWRIREMFGEVQRHEGGAGPQRPAVGIVRRLGHRCRPPITPTPLDTSPSGNYVMGTIDGRRRPCPERAAQTPEPPRVPDRPDHGRPPRPVGAAEARWRELGRPAQGSRAHQ